MYFNHPSQGNSTNYHLILGLRDKAAPPTSQQIPSEASEEPTDTVILFYFYFIFIYFLHPQESSALSQSEAMFVEQGEHVERSFFGP